MQEKIFKLTPLNANFVDSNHDVGGRNVIVQFFMELNIFKEPLRNDFSYLIII